MNDSTRRQFLTLVAAGTSILAGCSSDLSGRNTAKGTGTSRDSEPDSQTESSNGTDEGEGNTTTEEVSGRSPREVIEKFLNTFYGGDPAGFNEIRHSESPVSRAEEDQVLIDVNIEINNIEFVKRTDTRIVANVTTTSSGEDLDPTTTTREIELRKENGSWKFWYDESMD